MDFAEFMAEMAERAGHEDGDRAPKILPEAAIERLREVAALYAAGNTYEIGDLVTPRKGTVIKGAGDPHIVIDITSLGHVVTESPGSSNFGGRFDIRVLTIIGDRAVPFWGESWMYEPYRPA